LAEHQRGQGRAPVPPFGGMEEKDHYDLFTAEHFQRIQARTGRDPMQPESDKDVQRDVLNELYWPARLAGLGILLSMIASAGSLYLPPNV
jgi:hypothetical protein